MIVIAGTLDFADQANRDGAVAAATDLQQSTRDTEPGCLAYSFAADSSVTHRVQVYELWADAAALEAHFGHANFWAMKELLGTFVRAGSSVAKYRVDATAPVYDAERRPSAGFNLDQ
jgi:quinol monooxygenase YgiN